MCLDTAVYNFIVFSISHIFHCIEVLKFKLNSRHATQPTRYTKYAAGLDIYSAENIIISAREFRMVATDLSVSVPEGCYGRISARSGLAGKHGIIIGAGTIDRDFVGSIKVVMMNFNDAPYKVEIGDRIAQLICERIVIPEVVECSEIIPISARCEKGFGSSGK